MRFLRFNFVLTTLLLLGVPALHAQDGAEGALARISGIGLLDRTLNPLRGPALAVADFDGDNRPDGAVLLKPASSPGLGDFQVELHFTNNNNATIQFQSPESNVTVAALDIDHDGDIDIVIEQSLTHKALQVYINDGQGNFEKGRIENYRSVAEPVSHQVTSSELLYSPAVSLPTQRGFESMLLACRVAGRPPSAHPFAASSANVHQIVGIFSQAQSRAPPLS